MSDLHPHWHSTSDEGDVRSEPEPGPMGVHISVQPASRLPAAIAGIAIFIVVGITLAGGWQALTQAFTAQVGGSSSSTTLSGPLTPVEIHISNSKGFQPESVTVKPGQQIIWINDQSIPHILTSQTLRDGSGAYLNTPAIFPGARIMFTVGPRETDRTHAVTSTTDQTLAGTVIVSAAGAAKTSSSSRKAPLGGTDGISLPSGQGKVNAGGTSKSAKSAKSSAATKQSSSSKQASLPEGNTAAPLLEAPAAIDPTTNPYAGGEQSGGAPSTIDYFTPQDITAPSEDVIAPQTPAAKEQPNTGQGLWAVVLMTLAVLWGVTQKYFVKIG